VEVRTPDVQTDPDRTVAFVAYVHALVEDLAARYEDGESPTMLRREFLDANKWRATRYGRDAEFTTPDATDTVTVEEFVAAETDRLGVDALQRLLEAESGAARQRRIHREEGFDALCESLCID
jgi:carboxylate-amine ligase